MSSWVLLISGVLATITLLVSMSGCASTTRANVIVPVSTPKINIVKKPKLSLQKIKKTEGSPEIIKSYVLSLNQAISYSHQQSEIIRELNHGK